MIFAAALQQPASNLIRGALHHNYALALTRQHRNEEALEHFAKARTLNPDLPHSDAIRAEILQGLQRYDEAHCHLAPAGRRGSRQSGMAQIPQ